MNTNALTAINALPIEIINKIINYTGVVTFIKENITIEYQKTTIDIQC